MVASLIVNVTVSPVFGELRQGKNNDEKTHESNVYGPIHHSTPIIVTAKHGYTVGYFFVINLHTLVNLFKQFPVTVATSFFEIRCNVTQLMPEGVYCFVPGPNPAGNNNLGRVSWSILAPPRILLACPPADHYASVRKRKAHHSKIRTHDLHCDSEPRIRF